MTRDYALIILAGVFGVAAAVLVGLGHLGAAIAPLTGLAGVALGRLGGPKD